MIPSRQVLFGLAAAALVLTGCTNPVSSGPDAAESTVAPEDVATGATVEPNQSAEETLRPSRPAEESATQDQEDETEAPETGAPQVEFQEVRLEIFTGDPLPDAEPGSCLENDATPRCFGDDSVVYEKCVVDPYGSGQAACPDGSLEDLVVLDADVPGFDPALSYTEASGRELGFAEVRSEVSGEMMFCSPRTGGTGFDGPEPYTLWVGGCRSPDITEEDTYIYWFSSLESAEATHGYFAEPHAEQPQIAYAIHGPGFDENEIRYGDVVTWYY